MTVSGEQQFNPDGMTRPIVFATGAIHAGESSGTNAGMMCKFKHWANMNILSCIANVTVFMCSCAQPGNERGVQRAT